MTTDVCFIGSSALINISFLSCQHKYFIFREVWFLSLSQVICGPKMGKLCLLQCPQQHWDDNRRSKVWMTQWAGEFNTGTKIFSTPNQKETCCTSHRQSAVTMLMPRPLWVCLALVWVGSCSAHSLFTCEPIRVHRCLGMPYNMTFFPNMMDHYDQDIAAAIMEVRP